jgi:hypothetical protein
VKGPRCTAALALSCLLGIGCAQQAAEPEGSPSPTSPSPSPSPTVDPEEEQAALEQAECAERFDGLIRALEELDSRLNVGLVFQDYTNRVGDIASEYGRIRFRQLGFSCINEVGIPLEEAVNSYIDAQNRWNECIGDFGCDIDSIEPELQRHWRDATRDIRAARQGLRDLA